MSRTPAPTTSNEEPAPARDRVATRERIVAAAIELIASEGFTALGVRSLASRAGVDKKLIYRYFEGGLDGVIAELGARTEFWLGRPIEIASGEPYARAVLRLLNAYLAGLRENRLLQGLLAWELVEPSDTLQQLERNRSSALGQWAAGVREVSTSLPADEDAPALNALLIAGLHYLVLRQRSVGSFAGLDLNDPATWNRVERALGRVVDSVYGPGR